MTEQLEKKVAQAIRLLKATAPKDGSPVEVAYSGGKDSDVILQLVKESGIPYRAIYKNTTIDPPGTIKHALDMGAEMIRPEKTFFQLVAQNGFPNRNQRFCCKYIKEYKVLDRCVEGIRRCESTKRAERYQEPTACRVYKKDSEVEKILPILEWTDEDVVEFIKDRGIQCAPHYYDEQGRFHVERRLGCMACPLASNKKRIAVFKEHPKLVRQYLRAGKKFWDSHPDCETRKNYADVYEWFVRDVFFVPKRHKGKSENSKMAWKAVADFNLFGRPDFKAFLEEYFKVNLENL